MVLWLPVGGPLQLPVLDVAVLVTLVSLVASTAWLAVRSVPAGLLARQKRVEEIAAGVQVQVEEITSDRATWKAQGERLAEEVSGYLDQIERKRASTTAAASRLKGLKDANGGLKVEEMSRAQQIARCRQLAG